MPGLHTVPAQQPVHVLLAQVPPQPSSAPAQALAQLGVHDVVPLEPELLELLELPALVALPALLEPELDPVLPLLDDDALLLELDVAPELVEDDAPDVVDDVDEEIVVPVVEDAELLAEEAEALVALVPEVAVELGGFTAAEPQLIARSQTTDVENQMEDRMRAIRG